MRYLLASDSTPDKCTNIIWLLALQHSDYEPPPPEAASPTLSRSSSITQGERPPSASRHLRQWQLLPLSAATARPRPPKRHLQCPGAHCPPEFYTSHAFGPHIAPLPPHLRPVIIILKRDRMRPLPRSRRRSPLVLRQSVGGRAARRDR
jgi:hypothetical protein